MSTSNLTTIYAHPTDLDTEDNSGNIAIGMHFPASESAVEHLLAVEPGDDTRSEFVWVRLVNGDLLLGVFPQGNTYIELDLDDQK